jgi:hypothetical protein
MPHGLDPGEFWIQKRKPYKGALVKEIWDTAGQDLWVIQSPLKTFIITKENAKSRPIDFGVILMDKAQLIWHDGGWEIDPATGKYYDDPAWP